jgi:hypothetical protein
MKISLAILAAATLLCAADTKLGKPLALKQPTPIATLLAHPEDYAGKTVQVKGKITEVCQMMGCWMELTNDENQRIRIKVNDGEIVFPKDAAGRTAVAEGKFSKVDGTDEEAAHSTAAYQVKGTGAVILSQ